MTYEQQRELALRSIIMNYKMAFDTEDLDLFIRFKYQIIGKLDMIHTLGLITSDEYMRLFKIAEIVPENYAEIILSIINN